MKSPLPIHSHNVQDESSAYRSLAVEIATSSTQYPAFPTSLHHDPAIAHDMPGFGHGENAHTANSHRHIQHHGPPINPDFSAHAASASRRILPSSPPIPRQQGFSSHGSRAPRAPEHQRPPQSHSVGPPGQYDMLPPPNSTHPSWQALHDYAQSHASAHGYALSINTTAKNRARIKLACVCYGAPKNTHKLTPETRVRKNRSSYKTGCKMWVEGKKQEDGSWELRVGEPNHNHPGRAVEGWAVQRKRTWGVQGGRIGVGGVTAKEEQERTSIAHVEVPDEDGEQQLAESPTESRKMSHSLESGGLVWKIVEQEMLRKTGPSQGRDRGVGRTVKILEERLPGIHIFKRDVYNIRAQIKRARKAAGQQVGDGLTDSEFEDGDPKISHRGRMEEDDRRQAEDHGGEQNSRRFPEIDPLLVAQCNDALKNVTQQEEGEVDRLKREVEELREALARRTREVEERNSENESLRVQVELANMALYNERGQGH